MVFQQCPAYRQRPVDRHPARPVGIVAAAHRGQRTAEECDGVAVHDRAAALAALGTVDTAGA